ncbi:hypothetical protein [Flavobacterium sp. ZB4P13]|uniref:hypothetical protein n=1 Tax=Flavobacterium sp. ZB4P13 TaxID=3401728 RepID=UPI003AAF9AE1
MDRKEFLKTCGFGCLAGLTGASLLQSCGSSQVLAKDINGSDILVPLTDFEIKDNEVIEYKKYIIIQNEKLIPNTCII